MDEKKNNKNKS